MLREPWGQWSHSPTLNQLSIHLFKRRHAWKPKILWMKRSRPGPALTSQAWQASHTLTSLRDSRRPTLSFWLLLWALCLNISTLRLRTSAVRASEDQTGLRMSTWCHPQFKQFHECSETDTLHQFLYFLAWTLFTCGQTMFLAVCSTSSMLLEIHTGVVHGSDYLVLSKCPLNLQRIQLPDGRMVFWVKQTLKSGLIPESTTLFASDHLEESDISYILC